MTAPLVRGRDLLDPVCGECGHVEGFHGSFGCRFGVFQVGGDDVPVCGCRRTHHDVHLAHVEGIVRREVEKARKQVLQEVASVVRHKADVAESEDGGKLRTWDAYISVVDWCVDRIEQEAKR